MWRVVLTTLCCVLAGCSLLRAPVDDADAGPGDTDTDTDTDTDVPVITGIDGTGTARAVVGAPDFNDARPATHRLQDTLRVSGEHLDVVTSAVLIDDLGTSTPLALLQASSSTERDMRLPPTISAALYTLVLVASAGEARAQVFLLQGEQGVQGDVGLTSLVDTTPLLPGDLCAAGGVAVSSGIDSNRNAVLDDDEVDTTETVCAPTANDALNCTDDGCVLTQPLIVQSTISAEAVDVTGDITATTVVSTAAAFDAVAIDAEPVEPSPIGDREFSVGTAQELLDTFALFNDRRIAGTIDVVVTQDIAMTSTLTVRHPDGARIRLVGATPAVTLTFPDNGISVDTALTIEALTLRGTTGTGIVALPGAQVRVGAGVTVSGFSVGINATAARVSLANGVEFIGPSGARSGTGVFATDGAVVRAACTSTDFVRTSHYLVGWSARGNSVLIADRCRADDVERGFNINLGGYLSGNDAVVDAGSFVVAVANGAVGQLDRLVGTSAGQGILAADGAVAIGGSMNITSSSQALVAVRNGLVQASAGGSGTAFAGDQGIVTATSGFACSTVTGFCIALP